MKSLSFVALCLLTSLTSSAQSPATTLQKLADDFWSWRAQQAPFTGDDVNRLERPSGKRDWSAAAVAKRREDLTSFEARWKKIGVSGWPVAQQVDYQLVGAALARVRWELEINPRWKRDPTFYIEQTLTALVEALTVPAPYDARRSEEILTRIENIPAILNSGLENLESPPAPFCTVAVEALKDIRSHLAEMAEALRPNTTLQATALNGAVERAVEALEKFRGSLQERLPTLPQQTALGRDAYLFFLKNVAFYPYTPEEILALGRQEWNRAVAFETYEVQRNREVPPLNLARDMESWSKDAAATETAIRDFLEKRGILSVPSWMQHYTLQPMPKYLRALQGYGEMDDFTSASRLKDNCVRYITEPSGNLGYFWRATAQDPRPITVHEGIPGHYFQLCTSWKQEDPIRRHYYDSGANEGIGFYAEEMMLQMGLFDDSPHTREIIYNFMRLRALRVEVDVKLTLGQFSLEQAAKYLEEKVPMDRDTARQEAIAFSTGPGQAISYQIGKLQIIKFLAKARLQQGDKFNLRAFHDFVWKNGNVPISLQQWEYLGVSDTPDARAQ